MSLPHQTNNIHQYLSLPYLRDRLKHIPIVFGGWWRLYDKHLFAGVEGNLLKDPNRCFNAALQTETPRLIHLHTIQQFIQVVGIGCELSQHFALTILCHCYRDVGYGVDIEDLVYEQFQVSESEAYAWRLEILHLHRPADIYYDEHWSD